MFKYIPTQAIKSVLIAATLVMSTFSTFANATLVNWTLQNVQFTDGNNVYNATGTFSYDADTGNYSNANISFNGLTYTDSGFSFGQYLILENASDNSQAKTLALSFSNILTNAGGNEALSSDSYFSVRDQTSFPFRTVLSYNFLNGEVTNASTNVSAVPVPAAAWLFGSGLLGLAGLRRKKQA